MLLEKCYPDGVLQEAVFPQKPGIIPSASIIVQGEQPKDDFLQLFLGPFQKQPYLQI